MPAGHRLFGEIALERGYLTASQLEEGLKVQEDLKALDLSEKLGQILVKRGHLRRDQVVAVLKLQGTRPIQEIIEGYEIVGKIGQGGMGAVFKAIQKATGRTVALKILPPRFNNDDVYLRRFLREARIAVQLDHPNIVRCLDAGVSHGHHFMVMEFVSGENLEQLLRKKGKFPEEEVLRIADQVALALEHASRKNLVHRDIKPSNIMIADDGLAKLLDLGLARGFGPENSTESNLITQAGIAVGTPSYISPEQAQGRAGIDVRADLYSLGATMFHMLTGRTPYHAPSAAGILVMHISEPVPRAGEVDPSVSPPVSALVERMMAKSPARRFAGPEELRVAIREAQEKRVLDPAPGPAAAPAAPLPGVRAGDSTATIETGSLRSGSRIGRTAFQVGSELKGWTGSRVFIAAAGAGLAMMAAAAVIVLLNLSGPGASERGRPEAPLADPGGGETALPTSGSPAVDPKKPAPDAGSRPPVKSLEELWKEQEELKNSMVEIRELLLDLLVEGKKPPGREAEKILESLEEMEKKLESLRNSLPEDEEKSGRKR